MYSILTSTPAEIPANLMKQLHIKIVFSNLSTYLLNFAHALKVALFYQVAVYWVFLALVDK